MSDLIFSSVLPRDLDRVFVVAGGPSFRDRDLNGFYQQLRKDDYVLGVNKAYTQVVCDGVFTMDRNLFCSWASGRTVHDLVASCELFVCAPAHGERWPNVPGVHYLERVQGSGYNEIPFQVHNGLNSGWGAVHVAMHLRPREIVLLGFDLHPVPRSEPLHWWDDDASAPRNGVTYYDRWAKRFEELAATCPEGVRVVNANPASAVQAFPFTSYEEYGL